MIRNLKKIKGVFRNTSSHTTKLSIGYQSFILYAIAKTIRPQKDINTYFPFFEKSLEFISDKDKLTLFRENQFCFSYNVTGFELAFIWDKLGDYEQAEWWLRKQLNYSFKQRGGCFSINMASDDFIMGSRLYEILDLNNDYIINKM